MQRLSYRTETVVSNKVTRNRKSYHSKTVPENHKDGDLMAWDGEGAFLKSHIWQRCLIVDFKMFVSYEDFLDIKGFVTVNPKAFD